MFWEVNGPRLVSSCAQESERNFLNVLSAALIHRRFAATLLFYFPYSSSMEGVKVDASLHTFETKEELRSFVKTFYGVKLLDSTGHEVSEPPENIKSPIIMSPSSRKLPPQISRIRVGLKDLINTKMIYNGSKVTISGSSRDTSQIFCGTVAVEATCAYIHNDTQKWTSIAACLRANLGKVSYNKLFIDNKPWQVLREQAIDRYLNTNTFKLACSEELLSPDSLETPESVEASPKFSWLPADRS